MNYFFTIICDFKGGTYTKQVSAKSPFEAFEIWAKMFVQEEALTPTEQELFKEECQYSLEENNLTAMKGLQNVWYEGFSLEDDLLEVMIVATTELEIESFAIPDVYKKASEL